jgi:N-succinyldiaminopimelate aminotransferase
MNPDLDRLQSYPFQKLTTLLHGVTPNPNLAPISLYIGEPKHPTPEFIRRALADSLAGLASYPATLGATATGRIGREPDSRADVPEVPLRADSVNSQLSP